MSRHFLRTITLASAAFTLIGMLTGRALADDLNPPSWRFEPGSTFQQWEFSTPDAAPPPDNWLNPYGMPTMQVLPILPYEPEWDGRQGVWPLSGQMIVTIPNNPVPNPYKDIWLQLTWEEKDPGEVPGVQELDSGTYASLIDSIPVGGNWYLSTYYMRLTPNPPSETIHIDGLILVDELVIDTICVPEPGTLSILALGCLAFWLRRR